MVKYIESTLIEGEEILFSPEIHPMAYFIPVIRLAFYILIGLILCFVLGDEPFDTPDKLRTLGIMLGLLGVFELCFLVYNYLYYSRMEMAVTNKRVVCKTGIIGVNSEELQWNRIESIEIRQGIIGRLLNYGDVNFSGTGVSFVRFDTVKNPRMVKAKAAEILSK